MNRKSALILASCLIGILTTSAYLSKMQRIKEDIALMSEKIAVLTVVRDIKAGEYLTTADIYIRQLLKNQVSRRAISPEDVDLVAGHRVLHPIPIGEPVLWTDFPEGPRIQYPSEMIPPGQRALALAADEIHTLVHFISPGDHVDVVSSTFDNSGNRLDSEVIAKNIVVLCVGRQLANQSDSNVIENLPLSVTLLVTPENALTILRASQIGEIHFLARRSNPFSKLGGGSNHMTPSEIQIGEKS